MIIPPTWSLPDAIRTRLGQSTYGRQRAIIEEGHLVLVLHKPPGPDQSHRDGVLFWRSPGGDWQCNKGGPGMGGLKRHIQEFAELESQLVRAYEAAGDASALFEIVERVTPLARAARNLHQAVQEAREAVKGDVSLIELRDLAYEADRNLELLHQDVRNAIDYKIARESEEQARLTREALHASHRLNILAALFLPLTAISSVFGMNFTHGLDPQSPVWFWLVMVASLALGVLIKGWVLARGKDPS